MQNCMRSYRDRRSQSPRQSSRAAARFLALMLISCAVMGCAKHKRPSITTQPVASHLTTPFYVEALDATVAPPVSWQLDKQKNAEDHSHQVWISPSGNTAYGVIHFHMPLPVGHEWALWGFLREMRKNEGEATVIDKKWDDDLGALRFTAQGGRYTVRTILRVSGFDGLAAYAGTLTGHPVDEGELKIAEDARERTFWGK
jgi:hypothetical protein